jgi:hypothetical protein
MAAHQVEHSRQRLPDGSLEESSYLGKKGESFLIRTSGRGDFKAVNLINRETFALVDVFFTSEKEARLFADKKNLRIVNYNDNARSASRNQ